MISVDLSKDEQEALRDFLSDKYEGSKNWAAFVGTKETMKLVSALNKVLKEL